MKNAKKNILEKELDDNFLTNKSDIIAWLDKYEINNYKLIPDIKYGFIVDVQGDVNLCDKNLTNILVKFNIVNSNFDCGFNNLTNLEFCPTTVNGDFDCNDNKLTSLEFCPKTIGGDFNCNDNKLANLEFCPKNIKGSFYCSDNKLTSLEFCPETVAGSFYCGNNNLTSLEFCPETIGGDFYCENNKLIGVDMNKLYDFKEFYKIHCEHKIIAEQSKLEKDILIKDTYNKVNNRKIKI